LKDLFGDSTDDILINNGEGGYAIRIPARNISFDIDRLKKHWSGEIQGVAARLEQELEFVA